MANRSQGIYDRAVAYGLPEETAFDVARLGLVRLLRAHAVDRASDDAEREVAGRMLAATDARIALMVGAA